MKNTKIEWADASWNPISGCTPVSPGCKNCYARSLIKRFAGSKGWPTSPDEVTFFPERLEQPIKWKKPLRIFVCSMSDIFHGKNRVDWVSRIFTTMHKCPQHTFMLLTKRVDHLFHFADCFRSTYSLPNVWFGVTTENQDTIDKRIPVLLKTNIRTKFISAEPMLSAIDITGYGTLSWVICGAETGPGARPMDPDWARSLRDQCIEAGIPFFLKKLSDGTRELDGRTWINSRDMEDNHA